MLTHDQLFQAVELLRNLVEISPATPPTAEHIGVCHYCGAKVRNIHSQIIYHNEGCAWEQAKDFMDDLPSEWGE